MKPYAKEATSSDVYKFTVEDNTPARIPRCEEPYNHSTDSEKQLVDKTYCMSSRPSSKRTIRNANRSQTKSARQRLKKEMNNERED